MRQRTVYEIENQIERHATTAAALMEIAEILFLTQPRGWRELKASCIRLYDYHIKAASSLVDELRGLGVVI